MSARRKLPGSDFTAAIGPFLEVLHGAFGIPASEYEALKRDVAPVFEVYRPKVSALIRELEEQPEGLVEED